MPTVRADIARDGSGKNGQYAPPCPSPWQQPRLKLALAGHVSRLEVPALARQNFKYEKRQKELAKQKKNEEKRLRKLEKRSDVEGEDPLAEPLAEGEATDAPLADEAPTEEQPQA